VRRDDFSGLCGRGIRWGGGRFFLKTTLIVLDVFEAGAVG